MLAAAGAALTLRAPRASDWTLKRAFALFVTPARVDAAFDDRSVPIS